LNLPHHIPGAPDNFPDESNLILLTGGKVHAQWGEKEHEIIVDFSNASNAKTQEKFGVTLIQVMQITAICIQKTISPIHDKTEQDIKIT